jgi:hypothetical protein
MLWRVSVPAWVIACGVFVSVLGGVLLSGPSCRAVERSPSVGSPASLEAMRRLRDEHALVAEMIKTQLAARGGGSEPSFPHKTDRDLETVKSVQVYVLLGGLVGSDGSVTSAGMFQLTKMLRAMPDTTVTIYTWDKWGDAYKTILANQGKAKIVVVGYSGGGSRATWLANMPSKPQIDLMVNYDPSPGWQMKPIGANVKKALCYHNTTPMMWVPGIGHLGGGQLVSDAPRAGGGTVSPAIETVDIAEQHLLVQIDQSLHEQTVKAVQALAAPTRAQTESRVASLACKRVALCRALSAMRRPGDQGLFAIAELGGGKREAGGRKAPL